MLKINITLHVANAALKVMFTEILPVSKMDIPRYNNAGFGDSIRF